MDIELYWPKGMPDPALEALVVEDLRREFFRAGEKPFLAEDLIFHCVQLGPDIDGPEVMVWGKAGDHRFHCEYHSMSQAIKFEKADLPLTLQDKFWPSEPETE